MQFGSCITNVSGSQWRLFVIHCSSCTLYLLAVLCCQIYRLMGAFLRTDTVWD